MLYQGRAKNAQIWGTSLLSIHQEGLRDTYPHPGKDMAPGGVLSLPATDRFVYSIKIGSRADT
jgi:hypothetical protein